MKIHVLSDLHTEFKNFSLPGTSADIVVLAGDIGVGLGGIEWATLQFPETPVIYVPGNHEYYDHDIGLTDEIKAAAPSNIHVLNNDTVMLDGVRFLLQISARLLIRAGFELYVGSPNAVRQFKDFIHDLGIDVQKDDLRERRRSHTMIMKFRVNSNDLIPTSIPLLK